MSLPNDPFAPLRAQAAQLGFRIVFPKDEDYDNKRQVVNQRFSYYPCAIALCAKIEDVAACVNFCRGHNIKIRIRSGGHQHEGMSAANEVLIIDLTLINTIRYAPDGQHAWIPAGKALHDVYLALEGKGKVIPGGVCDTVHVGGLVQGGGWGLLTRDKGFTCDNIVAAKMVLASGEIAEVSTEQHPDLFWAIRGGGGGNFGIITEYKFKLTDIGKQTVKYVITYKTEDTRRAAINWAQKQCELDYDPRLTVGGRIYVEKDHGSMLKVGGVYYGTLDETRSAIDYLLHDPKPVNVAYTIHYPQRINPQLFATGHPTSHAAYPHSVTSAISSLANILNPTATVNRSLGRLSPDDGCKGKHANKVSSAYALNDKSLMEGLMTKIVDYIESSCYDETLTNYVSLHGTAGNAQHEPQGGSAVAFRERPFMFKFQAWWDIFNDPDRDKERNAKYVKWVQDFRKHVADDIDGAFINFQDATLAAPLDPNTLEGRLALLRAYYADKLGRLRAVKEQYDPDYFFDFGMSIPPANCQYLKTKEAATK
ncbi:MAG: FAD-binding oxidoreductase [Bacteroidota bacterium]